MQYAKKCSHVSLASSKFSSPYINRKPFRVTSYLSGIVSFFFLLLPFFILLLILLLPSIFMLISGGFRKFSYISFNSSRIAYSNLLACFDCTINHLLKLSDDIIGIGLSASSMLSSNSSSKSSSAYSSSSSSSFSLSPSSCFFPFTSFMPTPPNKETLPIFFFSFFLFSSS